MIYTGIRTRGVSSWTFPSIVSVLNGGNRKITAAHPVCRAIYFTNNNNNHVNYSSECSPIVGALDFNAARYGAGRKVNHYYSTWWRHMIDDNNNINTYLTNNVFFFSPRTLPTHRSGLRTRDEHLKFIRRLFIVTSRIVFG